MRRCFASLGQASLGLVLGLTVGLWVCAGAAQAQPLPVASPANEGAATVPVQRFAPPRMTGQQRASMAQPDRDGPPGAAAMLTDPGAPADIELGRRIYHDGVGADGQPVRGTRLGGIEASGAAVACVVCHRRSGLGSVEGVDQIAPIAGRFIFADDPRARVLMNFRNIKSFNQGHVPHTDASFAAAVRAGVHLSGRELSAIMPRFELSDDELRGVTAYLRTLSSNWSAGVTSKRVRFAAVITPDVKPDKRALFVQTLQAAVAQKNGNFTPGQRTMTSAAEMLMRTERFWDIEVWELHGAAVTWAAQLEARQRAAPVFALVSGLGEGEWSPVHGFCERMKLPCWFPIVAAPPARAGKDFYSLYFSAGVAIEAEVLALHLAAMPQPPARLIQVHADDAAGRIAADAARTALARLAPSIQVLDHIAATPLPVSSGQTATTLNRGGVEVGTAWMFWLAPDRLATLAASAPPAGAMFMSAQLAGAEDAPLSAAWKDRVQLVYPYEMPEKRQAALNSFRAWLAARHVPVADEILQSQVFFALTYLAETMTEMLDNLHGDYLIERAESMLSLREAAKAEDEARELTIARLQKGAGGAQGAMLRVAAGEFQKSARPMAGRADHVFAKREGTTVYPRLALAQGQRFASKGAYIVRFADPRADAQGRALAAESPWLVP